MGPGVILYPKPAGVTSHDVVARVRRSLPRGTKVGHAGTLDPFATGLLLVLVGRATRAQRWLMGLPKAYETVAKLGWRSTTGDRDGDLEETGRIPVLDELPSGELMQRPPAYSAVKVGGERLYEKARRGEAVEGAPRRVIVYGFELIERDGITARFHIECSSGTYVRSLIADLPEGDAYCLELERTAIGPFGLEDAHPESVLPLGDALSFMPERALDPEEAEAVSHGRRLVGAAYGSRVFRLTSEGRLIAVAEPCEGDLKPVAVFAQ
ncbi:MAG: tRNA pseudouridine(55) synthase TruB [Thermoleophilaceae bacterium]|nr:tRNA pseudouridine(55) synthase TruB [Thermoleophilaceae bacterium]